jgi:hypothetical protein
MPRMPHRSRRSVLLWAGVLLALIAAHDLTHALDDGLRTSLGQLALVAVPQWLAIAAIVAFGLRGDGGRATAVALLLGLGATVGFVVVHLLPFSPAPYWDLDPSGASWLLVWLPAAVGLAVAAVAWRGRRRLG